MTCQQAEKRIYVYTELTPRERNATDGHIETCAGCRRLLEAVRTQRNAILASTHAGPEVFDTSRMTQRIMNALHQKQNTNASPFILLTRKPSLNMLRYAMTVLSLLQVIIFVSEYRNTKETAFNNAVAIPRPAKLNTTAFHAAFASAKEKAKTTETSLYAYIANCQAAPNGDCEMGRPIHRKP